MATVSAGYSTGEVVLSTTTADTVTLSNKNAHKVLISNVSGAASLYANVSATDSAVAAEGTLTLDTQPSDDVPAQGTLTIGEPVTNGDTFTIDSKVYTLQTTLTNVDGNIAIGGSEAQTKLNIVAAVNHLQSGGTSGVPGTDFAAAMTAHPSVSISDFTVDDAVLTADATGAAGNSIVTTETFTHISNVFDAATLGTTAAGTTADTMTVDDRVYTFRSTLDVTADNEIKIGANLAATQLSLVSAFDLSRTPGTDYSLQLTAHATVTIAAFSANDAVLTAVTAGLASDSIVTTETFTASTNVFDATTLGGTTAGIDAGITTATATADHYVISAGLTLELTAKPLGINRNGLKMSIVGNGNTYVVQLLN